MHSLQKHLFWHLLPIKACALAQPIFLVIFKCYGCVNDQTWSWRCWLPSPEMGICKEAVNWKYLEIYQEFKHILKGHLCTRGSHTDSVLVLGTAAEVQLVTLGCNQSISSAVLCLCQAWLSQQRHEQPGTATNWKLNHEAAAPSAAYQEGSNLLSEAKRLNTRPVIKECSQYKTKSFPGTGTTGITAMSVIQVVCFRNEFHKFSNSCTGLSFKNLLR